jgi:predicted nucleotidyltransferase
MIDTKDQEALLKLIANYLEKDITCVAIGGTAMMFAGYKSTTKDIDLVFASDTDRKAFEAAIEKIGYKQRALMGVYDDKRRQHTHKPHLYTRGDERFDLFLKSVFGLELDMDQDAITERHDFLGKQELIVHILPKEDLILLKAITRREKDHEDIETIIRIEKNIDWDRIIDKAIDQKKQNAWILIDLEETMQQLKKITFIPSKHFERIYKAQK